jgi:hypothetical protein
MNEMEVDGAILLNGVQQHVQFESSVLEIKSRPLFKRKSKYGSATMPFTFRLIDDSNVPSGARVEVRKTEDTQH